MTEVTTPDETTTTDAPVEAVETPENEQVFTAEYVGKLRQEAGDARIKAKRADTLAQELVSAWAAVDGRLIDPADLQFDGELFDEDGKPNKALITAAIDELISRKPHLAARRPKTPITQGVKPEAEIFSLHDLLKSRA